LDRRDLALYLLRDMLTWRFFLIVYPSVVLGGSFIGWLLGYEVW
jgi:hypothetical protein